MSTKNRTQGGGSPCTLYLVQRPKNGVVDPGGVCVGEASGGDEGRQDELEEGGGADRGQRVGPLDGLHQDQDHALDTTARLSSV